MLKQVYLGDKPSKTITIENDKYRSVYCYQSKRHGIVTIFKSKKMIPMPFVVAYNSSTVFFYTYDEARCFVRDRFEVNEL